MSDAPTLEFRTIEDLHRVPVDKLTAFTTDLALWLQMHRLVEAHGLEVITPRDVFGWIDDGRHDVRVSIDVKGLPSSAAPVEPERQPNYGRCGTCEHVWIVAYVPMRADLYARVLKRTTCPMCGEQRKLFLYEPGRIPEGLVSKTGRDSPRPFHQGERMNDTRDQARGDGSDLTEQMPSDNGHGTPSPSAQGDGDGGNATERVGDAPAEQDAPSGGNQ